MKKNFISVFLLLFLLLSCNQREIDNIFSSNYTDTYNDSEIDEKDELPFDICPEYLNRESPPLFPSPKTAFMKGLKLNISSPVFSLKNDKEKYLSDFFDTISEYIKRNQQFGYSSFYGKIEIFTFRGL